MSKKNNSQVITCKAAVCWGAEELAVKVEEIQVDPPKSSEVRLKLICASICHSDLLFAKGRPFPLFPRVPGHEGVGVVESVGEEMKEVKDGDVVIPTFIGECKECENCTSGKTNLCSKCPFCITGLMPDNTSRMSIRGQKLYHLFCCSTWSEYTVINANYVVKIDPISISPPHASFISCGFSTGFGAGAAWKEAQVEKGSTVAVFGLGAVGLGGKGTVITVGAGYDVKTSIDCRSVLYGGTWKGSLFGGLRVKSDLPIILEKCKNKEFHLDELMTHEIS